MDYGKIKKSILERDLKLEPILDAYTPQKKSQIVSDYVRLVEIVIGQQLSGAAADTIFTRLTKLLGEDFRPYDFLHVKDAQFAKIGISKAKTKYCKGISEYLEKEPEYFKLLRNALAKDQIEDLMKFKGIGIWTASIFVMSSDIMSDVFAYGDATLSKVIKQTYNLDDKQLDKQLDKIVNNWSPYRTLVCKALWNYNDTILNQTLNRI